MQHAVVPPSAASRKAHVLSDHTPEPTAATPPGPLARLQQERLQRWHQNGEALLTFENARSWLNAAGLVLYVPRPQIPAPAPSFVEAVLGNAVSEPTFQQTEDARSLLTRLIAEGIAVPLNLLGSTPGLVGESPDYIASAGVFSYIFTLRGDKAWKQPPATSGASKVSQLAAHAYEILAKSQPRSASDLTAELGNAVTESAVLRALGELWAHLRVLPLPQPDGRATQWELASARYTKQIKAGANAGQPSALSALISLYLAQAAVATEEEIEIFLSPLASRSRTRDVLHALTAARQLDTIAIEGKTMVHIAGEAPGFLSAEPQPNESIEVAAVGVTRAAADSATHDDETGDAEQRIKKYVPKPRKVGTGPLAKGAPAKSTSRPFIKTTDKSFGPRRTERPSGDRPARENRFGGRTDRERRPFQKSRPEGLPSERKPRFDRPWDEDRSKRTPRPEREERRRPPAASDEHRDRRAEGRGRSERSNGGWKPAFRSNQRPMRKDFREESERPAKRGAQGSAPHQGSGFGDRPQKFSKGPSGSKRPFRGTEGSTPGGDRPPREFRRFDAPRTGGKRPFPSREKGEGQERRAFRPRNEGRPADRGSDRGFSARPAKFPSKRPGPPRKEGFSSRPRGEGFSRGPRREDSAGRGDRRRPEGARPIPRKGTSGERPARRTFKRKEDESA